MMPCGAHDALKAHCNTHHQWGQGSNKETNNEEEWTTNCTHNNLICEDKEEEEEDDKIACQADKIVVRICTGPVNIFKRVLLFYQGMAEALYDDQMITSLDILQELDNNTVKEVCHAIKKPCGGTFGHQISKLSMTHFKPLPFGHGTCGTPQRKLRIGLK